MLTHIYIEALLVDKDLADQVWEAWDKGKIGETTALIAWWLVAYSRSGPSQGGQKATSWSKLIF